MNKPDEYEAVKKEIRSLLITFKNGSSLFEFKKQYRLMMGHELPFIQFQFRDEIEFLNSMPDAVQISSTGRDYHLKVVVDHSTKHIQKLVNKQKSNKQKPVSRPEALHFVAPPPGFHKSYSPAPRFATKARMKRKLPSSITYEVIDLIRKYHVGLNLQDVMKRYRCCYGKVLHFTTYGFYSLEEFLRAIPQLNLRRIDNEIYVFCSSQGEDDYPRLLEMNTISRSLQHIPFDPYKKSNVSQLTNTDIQNSEGADKSGIVQSTSKENYGCFKQKMDCLDDFDLNLDKSLEAFPSSEKIRNDLVELLPAKAVNPLNQYTQQRLATRLVAGSFFPVYVANILNPGHMYIQLGDEEQALSDMNHTLEKFYTDSESRTFVMKDVHILPGSIGVAQWPLDMHWYRIKVMSLLSDDSVKVFFTDYGTMDTISKTLLRYIREDFISVPAQAMKASLAYVKPPRGFNTWSQRATDRILELTLDESVKAKVVDIVDDVLSVILYNQNDIYINGVLLDEHLAQSTSVDGNYSEPVDLSDVASALNNPICELPPAISSLSTEAEQPLSSTNQASQNLYEKPLACVNFSKPFETALTSATDPITCPTPQIANIGPFLPKSSSLPNEAAADFSSSSPSSNSSEVFDDDDDAFFEEFYQKVSLVTKRYVKRIRTGDGYVFHILIYESEPYVSCGDISHLIWSNKDAEFLLQRLQNSGSFLANVLIWEDENENMFDQLKRFHVKGLTVLNDRTYLLIFSLNNLVKILNIFGHPSVKLRTKIIHEFSTFNPNHPMWKELSEVEFSDKEEEFVDRTDDDKLNRLCLYDLKVMRENIYMRRQRLQLQQSWSPESASDEERKLLLLHDKIVQRMQEIHQICSTFSDS